MRPRTIYFIVSPVIIVVLAGWIFHTPIKAWWENRKQGNVPEAVSLLNTNTPTDLPTTNSNTNTSDLPEGEGTEGVPNTPVATIPELDTSTLPDPTTLPKELNIAVPFTSQAPHANWDADHGEFCEEASTLMVGRYFLKRPIKNADDAEAALQRLKAREVQLFGYHKDTTAAETARLMNDRYPVTTALLKDPTATQIKQLLVGGHLVVVPAAGRELKNPNFRAPGPLYHMFVVKGYTDDGRFITNDPGTRNGANYTYPVDRIMNAIHDWNDGDVAHGERVVIVVSAK